MICVSFINYFFPLQTISCLEGNFKSDSPCFYSRTGTIFQCPQSKLFSNSELITFEQSLNEAITATLTSYATVPLLNGRDSLLLHGVPPPKKIKEFGKNWQNQTKNSQLNYSNSLQTPFNITSSKWFRGRGSKCTFKALPLIMAWLLGGQTIQKMLLLLTHWSNV